MGLGSEKSCGGGLSCHIVGRFPMPILVTEVELGCGGTNVGMRSGGGPLHGTNDSISRRAQPRSKLEQAGSDAAEQPGCAICAYLVHKGEILGESAHNQNSGLTQRAGSRPVADCHLPNIQFELCGPFSSSGYHGGGEPTLAPDEHQPAQPRSVGKLDSSEEIG